MQFVVNDGNGKRYDGLKDALYRMNISSESSASAGGLLYIFSLVLFSSG